MNNKIIFFMGTRPEAIKMLPVAIHLRKKTKKKIIICSTGQHKELLDDVFSVFDIKPDIKFKLYNSDDTLNILLSKIYKSVSNLLNKLQPDLVLVHGDTANSMICSLAAFNKKIKIGHVEAGLRSFDNKSPWPEEIYRKLITNMSDFHFCPTKLNKKNLLKENISNKLIKITGNTVIDSIKYFLEISKKNIKFKKKYQSFIKSISFDSNEKNILVTIHRREKYGKNILLFCNQIKRVAKLNVNIFITLHHNPNIKIPLIKNLKNIKNINLIEPVKYDYFINLLNDSYLVISDSGGIQEEITILKTPLIVIRDKTERSESIRNNKSIMVGEDCKELFIQTKRLIASQAYYSKYLKIKKIYGSGNSSVKIANFLKDQKMI